MPAVAIVSGFLVEGKVPFPKYVGCEYTITPLISVAPLGTKKIALEV